MTPNRKNLRLFTLVELAVSIAVLSLLIVVSVQLIMTMQRTWNQTQSQRETYENARIALDLISRDLDSAYYGNGTAPFWHWKNNGVSNEILAFVSDAAIRDEYSTASSLVEIKYQLHNPSGISDPNFGWIMRSITGNKNADGSNNLKWNFFNNTNVGYNNSPSAAFTADTSSSEASQPLIPNVIDLTFVCDTDTYPYGVINPKTSTSTELSSQFPALIKIEITLLDSNSWKKWVALLNGNSAYADSFRLEHQRTLTKMVSLDDKGQ